MSTLPQQDPSTSRNSAPSELASGSDAETFLSEVLAGLRETPKQIPCKYLYDPRGSELFDRICELDEYYPTRTEIGILERHGDDIAARLGPGCLVVEPGSGAGLKTRILLHHLEDPAGYIPIEISCNHLMAAVADLEMEFPGLQILPVCGDFTEKVELPAPRHAVQRRVVFFPGSTIGNFEPPEAKGFLDRCRRLVGSGGALVIGVDLKKERETLERAYDDAEGITARFILNVLTRINRELGADFDLANFTYRARYVASRGRVEMEIVSQRDQRISLGSETVTLAAGESILAELSHKYEVEEFQALARGSGLRPLQCWTDPAGRFSIHLLTVPSAA